MFWVLWDSYLTKHPSTTACEGSVNKALTLIARYLSRSLLYSIRHCFVYKKRFICNKFSTKSMISDVILFIQVLIKQVMIITSKIQVKGFCLDSIH